YYFFQAEDGIRDYKVTGVQTCALPIYTVHATTPADTRVSDAYRWMQLAIGVAAMVMIANYQYGWTFFVPDIQKKFGWDRASIQKSEERRVGKECRSRWARTR